MKLPILYKLSAIGKISEWEVEAINDNPCYYVIRHGYSDGSKQEQITEVPSGKNIGKANETTMWEQCQEEAKSRWIKQRDRKGYSENIPTQKPLRPMLAKSYNYPGTDLTNLKDGKHIKYPCFGQAKLDGCVSGDTLIKTKYFGYRPIKWLVDNQNGYFVQSMNKNGRLEYKEVTGYFKNSTISDNEDWYEIELETGEKLKLTGNHPVYLPDFGCWRRVDELSGDENLMVL